MWEKGGIVYALHRSIQGTHTINGWSTPPGKLLTQIAESNLMLWFCISIALVILGIVLMIIEYFRKDS
ncbi:hypothetical protein D7Y06_19330 [Roseburia sp. 1XD42-69]|nr:hypothetical protein D7Y06_19330 [Roseburia sp. 1XD42-69]